MVKQKACLTCKVIFEGERCPICNETTFTDSFKGRMHIFNPEKSKIAKNLKILHKGEFTIKTK